MVKKSELAVIVVLCIFLGWFFGIANPRTEVEIVEVEKVVEVVPDGYVPLNECIPLEDINGYFYNENDYLCFELADVGNQLDNFENWNYKDIIRANEISHLEELEP